MEGMQPSSSPSIAMLLKRVKALSSAIAFMTLAMLGGDEMEISLLRTHCV
jgi:hypothetical protein